MEVGQSLLELVGSDKVDDDEYGEDEEEAYVERVEARGVLGELAVPRRLVQLQRVAPELHVAEAARATSQAEEPETRTSALLRHHATETKNNNAELRE